MAKASKRASKQKSAGALPAASSSSKPTSKSQSDDIPAAFTQAPSSLQKFLEPLSPRHVYLLHVDTHPPETKIQIFRLPLFLNVLVLCLVAYRIYSGIYTYPDILIAMFSQTGPAKIDTSPESSWFTISALLARRTFHFLFDYLLIALFLPWPVRFWIGPTRLRRTIGFRGAEVVIRKSREWSESLEPRVWIRDDESTMREKVVPAITPAKLQKTGYLLIDADWDLDFAAMIRAHRVVDAEEMEMDDFRTSVLVHGGGDTGWLVWRIEESAAEREGEGGGSDETLPIETRDKIVAFKDKLTEMGKEDLFFRWVEIIQYESTQPGGFTAERQRNAMAEVKRLFDEDGVDFEQFWKEVGGMEGLSMQT